VIIAFGSALLFFLALLVFALAAPKRTTETWASTMLPQAKSSMKRHRLTRVIEWYRLEALLDSGLG